MFGKKKEQKEEETTKTETIEAKDEKTIEKQMTPDKKEFLDNIELFSISIFSILI